VGGRVHSIKKNIEASVVVSKETGLEVNADETKYMVMPQDQNAGQSYNIRTDNSSFERVEQFKYWGTTIMNQFYSGRDSVRECLLSFSAESFVIQFAI
jgi:hypothetical protein